MKRSASFIDDEIINEFLSKEMKTKKKFTDLICSLVNYFSLIPTLIYNAIWFFYFKSLLESIGGDNMPPALEREVQGCEELYHWINYSLTWVIVCFSKGLFFLICVRICCGADNDCNMFCLLIKTLTSLIPCIFFIVKIPDHVNNYKSLNLNLTQGAEVEAYRRICNNMADELDLFYKWEYAYMMLTISLFCFVPAGAVLMCLKEYLKSRGKQE